MRNSIPYQEIRDQYFTKEQQRQTDIRVRLKIALRKLKEQREKLGITQEDLAVKAGVPRTTISKIESGYQNTSILKVMQVAAALNKNVEIKLVDYIYRDSAK
jgi:DNA-binding XRE family transcriptional regulator